MDDLMDSYNIMINHIKDQEEKPEARIVFFASLILLRHDQWHTILCIADYTRYLHWFNLLRQLPCLSFPDLSYIFTNTPLVHCDTSHPTYDAEWIQRVLAHMLWILGFPSAIADMPVVESTMCYLSKTGEWNPNVHIESTDQQHQEIKHWMLISKRLGIPRDVAKLVNVDICTPRTVERPNKRRKTVK